MEAEDLDVFGGLPSNSDSSNVNLRNSSKARYRPSPKRLLPPLKPIDFEKYIQEKCENKIKVLQCATFHQIAKPIIIFFNHFREKCAYHTKCLDKLYQLALKYDDECIDFIAGDMMDIDVMNAKWKPIDLFCSIVSPEKVTSTIFAIDVEKRVYEYNNGDKNLDTLLNFCENLLKGSLFKSQHSTETPNSSLVKICTSQIYHEMVLKASKYILLIVELEDYTESYMKNETNYEMVAQEFVNENVDVVFINSEKNYIPFELNVTCYPSLILIPPEDKKKFVKLDIAIYSEDIIINCIKSYLKKPEIFLQETNFYQPLNVTSSFSIDFENLSQYLQNNCHHYLKVFERQTFLRSNLYIIIAFMDFKNGKCLAHHMKWISDINQVALNLTSPREYFIADYKDIDVINPLWKPQDFTVNSVNTKPKVFGINLNKNKFVLKDFKSAASLFYFAYSLTNGELYISEPWPKMNDGKLVKTCIADSLNLSTSSIKQDIFLVIYYSNFENTQDFLQLLEDIAAEVKMLPIKLMKIDARLNCISLELDNTMYPIMYYIPQINKSKRILFPRDNLNKKDIVEFLIKNIEENKVN